MTDLNRNPLLAWIVLAILIVASVLLVSLAPAEANIGQGIKIVYIHVAIIWTGMAGLILTGLIGLISAIPEKRSLGRAMSTLGWISLVFFATGVGTSLIAEIINWGGIAWGEPRTSANINLLALATIVQVISSWLKQSRWAGILHAVVAFILVWTTVTTEIQLHPDDPIGTSSSSAIQWTFYGLFLLCSLIAAWIFWYLQTPYPHRASSS